MLKIIRFTSSWCQPCKALAPILDQLQLENPNISFETIDVDQNKEITSNYRVTSVPTIVFVKNGIEATRFTGVKSKTVIQSLINQLK